MTQELWFEKCIGNFEFIETKQGWPTLSPSLSEVLARVEAPMLDFGTDGKKEKRGGKRKTPAGTAAAS